MTTITIPNQGNFKLLEFSSFLKNEEALQVSEPFIAWWVYLVVAIIIFGVCFGAHFIVKKVNDYRLEERFIRLYGKPSVSTQVSTPTLRPDATKKLDRKFRRPDKLFKTSRGISLIFTKEQNKGRTSLTANWPGEDKWKKLTLRSIKLNSSSSLARKQSNTIQVYVSDNMSKSASLSQSQNGSTTDVVGTSSTFHKVDHENTNTVKQHDQIKFLDTNKTENNSISNVMNIKCVNNDNIDTSKVDSQVYKKMLGDYYGTSENNAKLTDKLHVYPITPRTDDNGKDNMDVQENVIVVEENDKKIRNEIQLTATNDTSQIDINDERDELPKKDMTKKPIALIIANEMIEKEEVEEGKSSERNINFRPPVTIFIPENCPNNETRSENDVSIKISINMEDNKNKHESQESSESKTLQNLSRSKESIKKSVSRVTFKHETMTPNVDDVKSSEASRSRTEFLKNSVSHSKESIMKSVTHSKESIKKQASRVTFVNGIKAPSSDSDSDIDPLLDAHFDITKITDSLTRLSEKTYSRESKLSDKIEENILVSKKHSSKVNFSEAVVTLGKTYPKRGTTDIRPRTNTAIIRWDPLNVESSKSLLDQMIIYKSNIEQKMSNLMLQEASTSKNNKYEELIEQIVKKPTCEKDIRRDLGLCGSGTESTLIETVSSNASQYLDMEDTTDLDCVHCSEDNSETYQDINRSDRIGEKTAHNTDK